MYWIQLIPIHAIKFANCVWNSALLLSISTLFISFSDLTNNVCTAQSALLRSFIIINCQTINCINFYQHSIQMSCEWFNNIETKMDKTNIIYQNIEINSRTQCILYSMSSTIYAYIVNKFSLKIIVFNCFSSCAQYCTSVSIIMYGYDTVYP